MYLKIRDPKSGIWAYINDFIRVEALDPRSVSYRITKTEEAALNEPVTAASLLQRIFDKDELVSEASFSVMDEEALLLDFRSTGILKYRVLRCVQRNTLGREEYYHVAFNTICYMCSDRGHTMDRFIVHKGDC